MKLGAARRSSSVVEQGTHKPLVGGSNPPSATTPILIDARHRAVRRASFVPGGCIRLGRRARITTRTDGPGPPSHGIVTDRRYTRSTQPRSVAARSPEAPFEPQVLPERHRDAASRGRRAALSVHLVVNQSHAAEQRRTRSSSPTSGGPGRQGRPAGLDPDRRRKADDTTYTVVVPGRPDDQVYDDMQAAAVGDGNAGPEIEFGAKPAPDTRGLGLS